MFKPATLREVDCTTELERGRLLVLGAPFEQVFLMKLYASRGPDLDDLIALWPRCRFTSPEDAAHQFEAAYPHAEPDPYLADHIHGIATAG